MAQNGISEKQYRGLRALMVCRTQQEAARHANVGVRTLKRWLTQPEFRAALEAAETDALRDASRLLAAQAADAAAHLADAMRDIGSPPGVRLRAALGVLDRAVQLRELMSLEERLTELEEAWRGCGHGLTD